MTRVVVVGAGIVGTMHALLAHRAGHEVVHLERDAGPRSASVRNFGLVWVSGRAGGAELATAMRARQLWEEVAGFVPGIGFRGDGSLTVALGEGEFDVMREFAATADAAERGITLVSRDEARRLNPAIAAAVHGALWCARDAIVEPGSVLGAIRDWLHRAGRYRFVPGREATQVRRGEVLDTAGERHGADVVVVCTGSAHVALGAVAGRALAEAPLRRVRLQMMQTAPYPGRLTTSLADADSMRYYPAYANARLDRLGCQDDVAAAHHMQLLLVQRASGGLTIGDTHDYAEPFDFAIDEGPYDYLRRRAESVLGEAIPAVTRRWAGVYSQCTDGAVCYRTRLDDDVWLVTGLGGRGMTCAPAVAEQTLRLAGVA